MKRATRKTTRMQKKQQAGGIAGLAPGHPIRIREGRKTIGFLISPQHFVLFERLVSEEEDRIDIAAVRNALQEPDDGLSLEELRAELGL